MLARASIISLLVVSFCVAGLPTTSAPKPKKAAKTTGLSTAQDPPLTLSTTRTDQPNGGTILNLTGRYTSGGKVVNLRAVTIKQPPPMSIYPGVTPNSAESPEEPRRPDSDYYYNDSEMMSSDGRVMVEAVYEYQEPTNRHMLYATLGGVTLTFDLTSEEVGPISELDEERLYAWLVSEGTTCPRNSRCDNSRTASTTRQ